MSNMSKQAAGLALLRIFETVAEEFDRDCPINQPYAFLKIATAGVAGIDQARLQEDLALSSAGVSRIVQMLSAVHYSKEKEGHNLVERKFASHDNRSRSLAMTPKGEFVLAKLVAILAGDK